MPRKEKNPRDKTKMTRVKRKTHKKIEEIQERNPKKSKADILEMFAKTWEENSKDSYDLIKEKLEEANNISENEKQKRSLLYFKSILEEVKTGGDCILDVLYEVTVNLNNSDIEKLLNFIKRELKNGK